MNLPSSRQNGAALIVALVALIVLTILGVTTMTDVMNQSNIVRNEQFRQSVFYAASSELNTQINSVNLNPQSDNDQIIDDLMLTTIDGEDMELQIVAPADVTAANEPTILTNPVDINLSNARITGDRRDNAGCPGEQVGKVKVIAGNIDTTAALNDGRGSIKSVQTQRYLYCWP